MKKVIALGGSNSRNSINKKLAVHVAQQLKNVEVVVVDLNDYELPLYGIDLEEDKGIPNAAHELIKTIKASDGIVLSLAEHNGVYSAAFKNTFDWMSRIDGKLWANIPMFLMATSPGARGGATVLEIAKNRFPYMGGNIVADFSFPSFLENFVGDEIINQNLKSEIDTLIEKFQHEIEKES